MVLASFGKRLIATIALVFAFFINKSAYAADKLSSGDTAWIITATALVLFMTLPGLALFYGGLVRARNVLSVLMHLLQKIKLYLKDHWFLVVPVK